MLHTEPIVQPTSNLARGISPPSPLILLPNLHFRPILHFDYIKEHHYWLSRRFHILGSATSTSSTLLECDSNPRAS